MHTMHNTHGDNYCGYTTGNNRNRVNENKLRIKMNNTNEDSDDVLLNEEDEEELDEIDKSKAKIRRKRNVSEWNREKRKRLRVAGKEYVNTKGELIRPRKIGADCKCRRKCYTKVDIKEREILFDNYYSLKSHDEQNAHLFELIRKHEIARRRSKGSEKRTCTFKYFVRLKNSSEIHVCRQAFCHIHAISAHKVRLLCEKLDRNVSYPRDERGRHSNRPTRIPDSIISSIKNHVLAIVQSDRLRDFVRDDKQGKNQAQSDLNITKMWRDFLTEHGKGGSNGEGNEETGGEWAAASVKLWLYNKVFHSTVSKEMGDALSKRINGDKNEGKGESNRGSDVEPRSHSASKESRILNENLGTSLGPVNGTRLGSSQNLAGVQDQSSFLFCSIAGGLNARNAQCYR